MKKFSIAVLTLAVVLVMAPAASADTIVFSFTPSPSGTVTASNTSITRVMSTGTIIVEDTNTSDIFDISHATVTISSIALDAGAGGSYVYSATNHNVTASYEGNGTITITDSVCISVTDPTGICLSGTDNTGTYSASTLGSKNGSFGGGFDPTYVSPYITSLFPGDVYTSPSELAALNPDGSGDSYLTKGNTLGGGNNSIKGTFEGTGTITNLEVLSGVPEPSSLMLLGTGLLGLAGMLHSKRRA